jgi:hypothetical protein
MPWPMTAVLCRAGRDRSGRSGGLPEAAFTAWTNRRIRAASALAKALLIHGGTSGIGSLAIQIFAAAGTGFSPRRAARRNAKRRESLGAARAINYREEDFVAVVKARPAAKAWTSFWTWSAATMSSAISRRPRLGAASSTSPFRTASGPRWISPPVLTKD